MKTHRQPIQLLALVTLVLSMPFPAVAQPPQPPPQSEQCTAITFLPYTISTPGNYCLTADLTTAITSGNAITIEANSVVLDLRGHKLAGSAGSSSNANGIIAGHRKYVVVKNGTVRGFFIGVGLLGNTSTANIIEGITSDASRYVGLWTDGTGGIIRHNVIVNTGGTTIFGANADVAAIVALGSGVVVDNDIVRVVGTGTGTGEGVITSGDVLIADNRFANMTRAMNCNGATKYRNNLTTGVTSLAIGGIDAGGNN